MATRFLTSKRALLAGLLAGTLAVLGAACSGEGPAPAMAPVQSLTQPTAAARSDNQAPPPALPTAPAAALTQGAQAPASAAPVPAGALRFQVTPEQSKATFRVREQLAGVQLPSDAAGTTGAVTGQLVLTLDGGLVTEASKIAVDLRQLKTDDARRDNFIQRTTLATQQFPMAQFVPVAATGLPSPLPASGEYAFTLVGPMTIHGVQKDLTWDVTARREGGKIAGTATTSFKFGDFGMSAPRVPLVLSIVDEIRLEVNLVATETAA